MPDINPDLLREIEIELEKSSESPPYAFHTISGTHKGFYKDKNEDSFYVDEHQGLWLVADGMGGHARGSDASANVVDNVRSFSRLKTLSETIKDLETRFLLSNNACRTMYQKQVVGSTVAAFLAYQTLAIFLWAGDSRVYRLREGVLKLMTEDHNLAQELVRRGEVSLDDAQMNPSAHVLTRAIGIHQNLKIEMQSASIKSGDRYLISSDGLYRDFNFDEVEKILGVEASEDVLDKLVSEALSRGGRDNITGILVSVA